MALAAILLVALSAVAHAGWNFLCKFRASSGGAFFLILTLVTVAALLPCLVLYPVPFSALPHKFWILAGLTGMCQVGYFVGLTFAYRLGDMSVAYPLTRSLPVVFLPVITGLLGLGKVPSVPALSGMLLIFAGCVILPHKKFDDVRRWSSYAGPVFPVILLTAGFVTGYSIIDREELRILAALNLFGSATADAFFFMTWENISILLWLTPFILLIRRERETLKQSFSPRAVWFPVLAALLCSGGYLLVLLAMQLVSNVSYVIAFRQIGVPIGAALGIVFLKEPCPRMKADGIILIVTGLVLVAVF